MAENFTWDNPEQGVWWHALDETGLELYLQRSPEFGKQTAEMLDLGHPYLQDVRCIRFRPSVREVENWHRSYAGALLVVDPAQLDHRREVGIAPEKEDRHVDAQAVMRVGRLVEPLPIAARQWAQNRPLPHTADWFLRAKGWNRYLTDEAQSFVDGAGGDTAVCTFCGQPPTGMYRDAAQPHLLVNCCDRCATVPPSRLRLVTGHAIPDLLQVVRRAIADGR